MTAHKKTAARQAAADDLFFKSPLVADLRDLRDCNPRAGIIVGLIMAYLHRVGDDGVMQADLCRILDNDPDSSAVANSVKSIAALGFASRHAVASHKNGGYHITLIPRGSRQ